MSAAGPRLRVAVDATSLLDRLTGVGRFTSALVTRLHQRDDVDLVAYGLTRIYLDDLRALLPAGCATNRRPIPKSTALGLWRRFGRPGIEWWTGPADVVHGTNFIVPPARRATELVTIHDLTTVRFPELCDAETVRYPAHIAAALRRGAHVHTVSAAVAGEVVEHFDVPAERVHVVHNGVDIVPGDAARGRARAGADRYVLALGTVEPRKNLPVLVEAFDAVAAYDADLRLVIAGGDGWGAEAVDVAIGAAAHQPRIVRLGWLDDAERADVLTGATALAYPSLYEGFGLPPLEAMAAGVPVVASTAGALPEVLGDAAVLVAPTADEVARGLTEVLGDDRRRAGLIVRGRERAARYSWDRCADELVELYARLA